MEETINRVITCGVRWGAYANSYAELMTNNGVCILGYGNRATELFRTTQKGDLLALKDGRNIIALAKPKLDENEETIKAEEITWGDFFNDYSEQKLSDNEQQQKADYFGFLLEDIIDVITIEEWVLLETPIYYPIIQSTVSIKKEEIKNECINRFNETNVTSEEYKKRQIDFNLKKAQGLFSEYTETKDDNEKLKLSKELLDSIDVILRYDSKNEIANNLKDSIMTTYLVPKRTNKLSKIYKDKSKKLKLTNFFYIGFFIITILAFITFSICYIKNFDISNITKDNLIVFIFTKGTIVSSIIASIFWLARFLNRRIHENVYLMEEYEYRALMFDSLLDLKDVFAKEMTKGILKNIVNKVIENPAVALMKKNKGNKKDIEYLEKLIKTILRNIPKGL